MMKILLWLAILILFIALSSVIWRQVNQQETELPIRNEDSTEEASEPASPLDAVTLSLSSPTVIQGEPVLVTIDGPINSSAISWLAFGDTELEVFENGGTFSALVGIGLHRTPGVYPIVLALADGRTIEQKLEVKERVMATTEFDIPEQLGGNTREAERALESTLEQDTKIINAATSVITPEKLWDGPFRYPRDEPIVVTDTYGYSRQTGSVNLSHNGTDFRAAVGTPVYAMNGGKVAVAQTLRNYGQTVIIDHGLGVMTMYMHLSEIAVELNENVKKGDLIAKSGNSGYSLAPHLHLSVRIGGFSIDPEKFLDLMGEGKK